jgi:hypothetical protein
MSIETIALERGRPTRRYVTEIKKLFAEVKLITGQRPQSLSQDGDELVVTWADGVDQRAKIAHISAGAHEIRTRRREFAEFKTRAHRATQEAAHQARLRLGG